MSMVAKEREMGLSGDTGCSEWLRVEFYTLR